MTSLSRLRWLAVIVLTAVLAGACSSQADVGAAQVIATNDVVSTTTAAPGTTSPEQTPATNELIVESSGASDGDLVLLSADEIEVLLAGNTIIGNWVGEDYRQFFDEDGTTTYRPVLTGRDSAGEWRVNTGSGLYESLWPGVPTWDDYEVHREDDTFFWSGQGVQLSPFTVVEGNQLDVS